MMWNSHIERNEKFIEQIPGRETGGDLFNELVYSKSNERAYLIMLFKCVSSSE